MAEDVCCIWTVVWAGLAIAVPASARFVTPASTSLPVFFWLIFRSVLQTVNTSRLLHFDLQSISRLHGPLTDLCQACARSVASRSPRTCTMAGSTSKPVLAKHSPPFSPFIRAAATALPGLSCFRCFSQ
ncbi:hypothetical protein C8Q75DRAFT_292037 [Abortiporus biennis]|nr:hypothetical protein C8Q75DRAFT_292037 [Abortiporus biennis]